MDSPVYSQDEFDLNLPFHHHHLKDKFNFLLEKSIASTKGSPLITPDQSVLDLKLSFQRRLERIDAKKVKKIDLMHETTRLFDMASSKGNVQDSNKEKEGIIRKKIEKKPEKKNVESGTLKPPKTSKHSRIKWTEEETKLFYRSLEQYGTDFSIIAHLFKNRDRIQIKNKFLKEEKLNPEKIHFHLNNLQKKGEKLGKKIMKFHEIMVGNLANDDHEHHDIPDFTLEEFKNEAHDHFDHKIHHHVCEIIKDEGESLHKRKKIKDFMKSCI